MKQIAAIAVAVFSLAVFVQTAPLRAQTTSGDDLGREIFLRSSLGPSLETLAAQLDQLVILQAENFSATAIGAIRKGVAEKYASSAVGEELVERIRERIQLGNAQDALAWLRSPIGLKINELETIVVSHESQQAIQSYLEGVREHPEPPERSALVQHLVIATRQTERSVDMALSMMEALVLALDATQPAETRRTPDFVRGKIRTTRAEAMVGAADHALSLLGYAHSALAIEDLRAFVEFAESEPGRWYYETLWHATQSALDAIALRFQRDLIEEIARLEAQDSP